jgi:hypothetical protein
VPAPLVIEHFDVIEQRFLEGSADQHAQSPVGLRVSRIGPLAPCVESARRDIQRPTQLGDSELGLLRSDPGKPYCWCFANKAGGPSGLASDPRARVAPNSLTRKASDRARDDQAQTASLAVADTFTESSFLRRQSRVIWNINRQHPYTTTDQTPISPGPLTLML